jgi:hypothetical protein
MDPGPSDSCGDADRLASTRRLEADARTLRLEQAKARSQAIREQIENGQPQWQRLHDSAMARLQARLDSMPVIEQAKGILMAQHRCGPDEAFDLLRRASQRANVKVSILAAQIVEQIASSPQPEHSGR